jgi:hypothetical protein
MSPRGFGKNEELQKQFKKTKKLEKNLEDKELLQLRGIAFGNQICSDWTKQAQKIRFRSEESYGSSLIEARFLMITALTDLQIFKAGTPGETNEELGEILGLVTIFWQGQFYTEQLISQGQYVQAAGAIKQEIEILARIAEINEGVAKVGKTPSVKYAPSGFNLHYGDMNNIAHISKPSMLSSLIAIDKGSFRGVSIEPIFHEELSKHFYKIHLSIFYNSILEAIQLFQQLYPNDMELVLPACKLLEIVKTILVKSGFTFD